MATVKQYYLGGSNDDGLLTNLNGYDLSTMVDLHVSTTVNYGPYLCFFPFMDGFGYNCWFWSMETQSLL